MIKKAKSKKHIVQLKTGECFTALIDDIKQGQITVRLPDGGKFTARTFVPPEAHIGEESAFVVRENNGRGLIKLEFVKPQGGETDGKPAKRMIFDMRV